MKIERYRKLQIILFILANIILNYLYYIWALDIHTKKYGNFDKIPELYPAFAILFIVILVSSYLIFNYFYVTKVEKTFTDDMVTKLFPNLDYELNKGISARILIGLNIFKNGNRYKSNNLVHGTYKNISFEAAEIDYDLRVADNTYPIFYGKWIILKEREDIQNTIRIFPRSKKRRTLYKKSDIKTGNKEFDKKYLIIADKDNINNIINDEVINKILKLSKSIKKKLVVIYDDSDIHIGIFNHRSLFSNYPLFKKFSIDLVKENITKEIKRIESIIDIMR